MSDESKPKECTCDGSGWSSRFSGRDAQYRICAACWEEADEDRRKEIENEIKEWRMREYKIHFPSGRFA